MGRALRNQWKAFALCTLVFSAVYFLCFYRMVESQASLDAQTSYAGTAVPPAERFAIKSLERRLETVSGHRSATAISRMMVIEPPNMDPTTYHSSSVGRGITEGPVAGGDVGVPLRTPVPSNAGLPVGPGSHNGTASRVSHNETAGRVSHNETAGRVSHNETAGRVSHNGVGSLGSHHKGAGSAIGDANRTLTLKPTITDEGTNMTATEVNQTVPLTEDDLAHEQAFVGEVGKFLGNSSPGSNPYRAILAEVIGRAKSRRTSAWKKEEKEGLHDDQFLKYMKCPTSVRTRMWALPFTRSKFVPESPILAWKDHYTPGEYRRLAEFNDIFGWNNTDETLVSSTLAGLNSSRNTYMFDGLLDEKQGSNHSKCIRCAVIGSGGILNGSRMGQEIDAHDYVFRVNTALTKGFEDDVGSRTSFYCFGINTLARTLILGMTGETNFTMPPGDKGIRYVFFADHTNTYPYLASVLHGGQASGLGRHSRVRFSKPLQAEDIKLVHPDFQRYLKWSWVNSTDQHKEVHRPTTGGIMLLLALHTCDEVNVYGFGGSYERFSEYYYNKKFVRHSFFTNHDNHAENRLWRRLDELGIIRLYKRD